MKNILLFTLLQIGLYANAQKGFEYYILNSEVDEFDVLGSESYETNLNLEGNLTQKLGTVVGADNTAAATETEKFDPKNTLDNNMKTAWLTTGNGKNAIIEFIIDIEENENVKSAVLYEISLFNGWRKDYQTWNDYSRIKKISLIINDKPYAEITLENTYKNQYIDLGNLKIDKSRRFKFRFQIMETYSGKKYEQVGLSDIQFIGKAK
jgi:hypothetical protein